MIVLVKNERLYRYVHVYNHEWHIFKHPPPSWTRYSTCRIYAKPGLSYLYRINALNPYSAGIDLSRQNLTSKVYPRTARVKIFLMLVD